MPLRRKELSGAWGELLIFIHAMETPSRTEVMTNYLRAALSSNDQCANAWFLGRIFFQEQTLLKVLKVFVRCVRAGLAGMGTPASVPIAGTAVEGTP